MKYFINIETSTDICSVALSKDGEIVDFQENTVLKKFLIVTIFLLMICLVLRFQKDRVRIRDLELVRQRLKALHTAQKSK